MQIVLIVLSCSLSYFNSTLAEKPALRVVDGRDASLGEYPYAVRLEIHVKKIYENRTVLEIKLGCTGAALTPTITLTADHCARKPSEPFMKTKRNDYDEEQRKMIKYGNPHLKPSESDQLSAVLKYIKPRNTIAKADIALLENEPIKIDEYAKISAMDYNSLIGQEVAIVGYGLMKVKPDLYKFAATRVIDKPLQVIDKSLVSKCGQSSGNNVFYATLCAVPACGTIQSAFHGDSGGPVVHTSGLVGVTTGFTDVFFHKARPSMNQIAKPQITQFVAVGLQLDWIYSKMIAVNTSEII